MLVIDAANVVGSRPDGWWRDRPGAAARLLDQIGAAVDTGDLAGPAVVVLEGRARAGAAAGTSAGVEVVHAPADGDATIVELVEGGDEAVVVTADRALRELVRARGATVVGPRWLLDRIED